MVPLPQNSKSSWIRRRGGGLNSDTLDQMDSYNIVQDSTVDNKDSEEWFNTRLQSYAVITVLAFGILFFVVNRWGWCGTKRARRKRTIGRLRRVIQAITVRKVTQM